MAATTAVCTDHYFRSILAMPKLESDCSRFGGTVYTNQRNCICRLLYSGFSLYACFLFALTLTVSYMQAAPTLSVVRSYFRRNCYMQPKVLLNLRNSNGQYVLYRNESCDRLGALLRNIDMLSQIHNSTANAVRARGINIAFLPWCVSFSTGDPANSGVSAAAYKISGSAVEHK
jgi:hypothetical protein